MFNPAAQAITFSSSNLVTAYIPGSGVVYAGNVTVSQGSYTEPGGTPGNITWNPGSVAAGATATLYYMVDVTPTSDNQVIPLTGIPTSNGTTATYVDETGNTSQTRATYTYGPLCGLSVTEGGDEDIPTWVAISCFEACESESRPTVEWHTASEIGVVGFNLWRQDRETKRYELVNTSLLPTLPSSPQGGVYRLADPGAFSGEPVVYQLEEIDAQGRTRSYGPFTVVFGGSGRQGSPEPGARMGREEPGNIFGYRRFERGQTAAEQERVKARRQEQQRSALQAVRRSRGRARVTVQGRGVFYVTAAQVANSMGMNETVASSLISGYRLRLTGMGEEIAWLADANGAGLFFYNEGQETVFSNQNVYYLERGSGLAMRQIRGIGSGPAADGQSFRETTHFEGNRHALMLPALDPLGDVWFWDYVVAGGESKSFALDVPGVAGSGESVLTVTLQGATEAVSGEDHHAFVFLNGRQIGAGTWDGTNSHAMEIAFDASLLQEGANTISVSGALDMGAPHSVFYVESFDLSYQRRYRAVGDRLVCRGDNNAAITVSGLSEPQALVLDVSAAKEPLQLVGVGPDLGGRVSFVPSSPETVYLVSGLNAALRPLAVVGDSPSQLLGQRQAPDYVVIAPEELSQTAQELADFRQGKGLTAMVVTLEDIYESFSHGMPDPQAIRDYLTYVYTKDGGKLKYAVLAGKGTYDYNDWLGYGDNLVPVLLGRTPEGLCAADKGYGDVSGDDGLPEIAIGRLPAVTNAELRTLIEKTKAYESGEGAWTGKAMFIADNADNGGDFAQGINELAGLATGLQAEKIYLADAVQEARSRIIASWNAGTALVTYCGHAGIGQLATENIFNVSDAGSLQNGNQLPLAMMLTCAAGRFELPGFTSLGEALLLNGNGGMAGGLVPSGAGLHGDSLRLGAAFYKTALLDPGATVGTALRTAMRSYLQLGGNAALLNVYNWLGDPALAVK